MMFAKKCPKCGGKVQTKAVKKAIGLGTVDIPVSQFCLNPSCDWYQDFAEVKKPEEIKENVLQIGLPNVNKLPKVSKFPEIKKPAITSKHIIALGGIVVVFLVLLIIYSIFQAGVQQPGKIPLITETPVPGKTTPGITNIPSATQTPVIVPMTSSATEPEIIPVKFNTRGFYPAVQTINISDTIRWNNIEKQRPRIVLMSNDDLFAYWTSNEPDSFSFQFNEPGTYTFVIAEYPSLKAYPNATGRVIVK